MSNQNMTPEQELAMLRAENAKLKSEVHKASQPKGRFKVSEKGCLSVYGIGRFPVTLYKSQWLQLFAMIDEIKTFIDSNPVGLKDKPTKPEAVVTAIASARSTAVDAIAAKVAA